MASLSSRTANVCFVSFDSFFFLSCFASFLPLLTFKNWFLVGLVISIDISINVRKKTFYLRSILRLKVESNHIMKTLHHQHRWWGIGSDHKPDTRHLRYSYQKLRNQSIFCNRLTKSNSFTVSAQDKAFLNKSPARRICITNMHNKQNDCICAYTCT